MPSRIGNARDFWSGIFFVALGSLAIYFARDYPMGSALEPGPGYFPTWLGAILVVFGAIIGSLALKLRHEILEPLTLRNWGLRPWLVLPSALAAYALLMEADFGFVPSLVVLIVGCALAHRDVHWRETAVLSVFLTSGAVAVFVYGLGLPYRLFWWSP